jgi:hypothetical protein
MRAPAQLDNSNRGHVSPPEPLLFGLCDTKYHLFHAARNHPLLATIAAQQAFQRSPGRRAVHSFLPAPCIYLGMAVARIRVGSKHDGTAPSA